MVVAPGAIVESFSSIGSSIMYSHLPSCIILLLNFVGCAPSALDGSSPRGDSALKVIVWGNLVWENANFDECFVALHMISVPYPLENSLE
jgi:hypothetical protein